MAKSRKQFQVIIERGEDGFFVASAPALPGCHTQARTLDALTKRIKEAIALCLEVAKIDPEYRLRVRRFSYELKFVGVETVEV